MAVNKVYALTIMPRYSKQKDPNNFPILIEKIPDNKRNSNRNKIFKYSIIPLIPAIIIAAIYVIRNKGWSGFAKLMTKDYKNLGDYILKHPYIY